MKFSMSRKIGFPELLFIASATLLLAGCSRGGSPTPDSAKGAAGKPQSATQVIVMPAHIQSISQSVDVTGTLNTLHDVTVGVKAAGKILGVYAREGDHVSAGQLVAEQDPADVKAQLDTQYANLQTARTKLSQAEVGYASAKTNLDLTKNQTAVAVKQAEAGLRVAQEQAAVVHNGAREQERKQAQDSVNAAKSDRDRATADQDRAKTDLRKANSDLARYKELLAQNAIAAQTVDQAQAIADSAEAGVKGAASALASAESRYQSAQQALSLIQEGARSEDLRKADATVEQARQMLATAKSNREQVKLRQEDVQNAAVAINTAKSGIRQAQASVDYAKQQANDTRIISPIDGVVAERKAEPGMQLGAGKDIMRLVALNTIYFDGQLSESQFSQVKEGQLVKITVDAISQKPFAGRVTRIFPVASATARSFTVRIAIPNVGNALRPNLFARGQITVQTHNNIVAVPREVILDMSANAGRVFLVINNTAEERKVTLGLIDTRMVEIKSGVHEGDQVIVVGQAQVQKGDKVQTSAGGSFLSRTP